MSKTCGLKICLNEYWRETAMVYMRGAAAVLLSVCYYDEPARWLKWQALMPVIGVWGWYGAVFTSNAV